MCVCEGTGSDMVVLIRCFLLMNAVVKELCVENEACMQRFCTQSRISNLSGIFLLSLSYMQQTITNFMSDSCARVEGKSCYSTVCCPCIILRDDVLSFREKVVMLESVESQMKLELRTRAESDAQVRELEARQAEAQLKSQQIIAALKTQVGEQSQMRVSQEACWSCFLVLLFHCLVHAYSLNYRGGIQHFSVCVCVFIVYV